jgi:hypothetical protein
MARMSRPKSPGSAPRKPKGPKIFPHRGIEIIPYHGGPFGPNESVQMKTYDTRRGVYDLGRREELKWRTPVLQQGVPGVDYEYRPKAWIWHLNKKRAMAYVDMMMGIKPQ